MTTDWFESWFDSPYYHILYKDRNDEEAALFIDHIVSYLQLPQGATVWDLCCGKGRHSIYLHKKGFRTIGTDLSANSIRLAREHETKDLDFFVHDMRQPFRINFFDAVFNLFTSFGYFKNERDNHKVFKSVYNSLKPGGLFVIDYLNSDVVKNNLTPHFVREIEGIVFTIDKKIEDNVIIKDIRFSDKGRTYHYKEEVRLFNKESFSALALANGFELVHPFGDYDLHEFNPQACPRLILVFRKK